METLLSAGSSVKKMGKGAFARLSFLKKKRWYLPLALILIGVGAYFAFAGSEEPSFETALAARQDVVQVVSQTGVVEPAEAVDLSFTGSGRIERIYVTEGQVVRRGQLIATLASASEYANLLSARARLNQQLASAANADASLDQTRDQQDQLVENTERELRTGDLRAYLVEGGSEVVDRDHTPPTISGSYTCRSEGVYRIELYPSRAQSGGSFRFSGIESGLESASTVRPIPLGSCGLFIQFPENFITSRTTVWEIPIPNVRSDGYQTRLNAYDAAVEARASALTDGRTAPIRNAQIAEARASVLAAEAAFAETRLVAPFSGVVTSVDGTRGAIASPGAPVVSLISSNAFEIRVPVPEDDISEIQVGDRAEVSFDAFDGMIAEANVSFISPQASADTGATTFDVTLQFAEGDDRIRAGLSADVDIIAAERTDVISVPTRAVIEEDGTRYVRVMVSETSYRRVAATTGLSGSGIIEVTDGLKEGDRVITFANEEALGALTEEE